MGGYIKFDFRFISFLEDYFDRILRTHSFLPRRIDSNRKLKFFSSLKMLVAKSDLFST